MSTEDALSPAGFARLKAVVLFASTALVTNHHGGLVSPRAVSSPFKRVVSKEKGYAKAVVSLAEVLPTMAGGIMAMFFNPAVREIATP